MRNAIWYMDTWYVSFYTFFEANHGDPLHTFMIKIYIGFPTRILNFINHAFSNMIYTIRNYEWSLSHQEEKKQVATNVVWIIEFQNTPKRKWYSLLIYLPKTEKGDMDNIFNTTQIPESDEGVASFSILIKWSIILL